MLFLGGNPNEATVQPAEILPYFSRLLHKRHSRLRTKAQRMASCEGRLRHGLDATVVADVRNCVLDRRQYSRRHHRQRSGRSRQAIAATAAARAAELVLVTVTDEYASRGGNSFRSTICTMYSSCQRIVIAANFTLKSRRSQQHRCSLPSLRLSRSVSWR
ncbi:hypothetical protein Y032_0018g3696 [Ancylostoma ceylanicum]|uniref:Uncharacterized protein n=1 Tax=Ancylostoma ceylanicum TaxID=53326 RepID=A0A016V356_9BILA|nr:hypothetical protein Y032_0018g3696 [Ancylostoma ceylanicum]